MSTMHYLVDAFGNPVTTAQIVDVRAADNGQSLSNGCFVVRVPDYVQVQSPSDVSDLILKKFQGMLSYYVGFTHIAYDDMLDTTDINMSSPGTNGKFGSRNTICIFPGGSIQTTSVPLASTPGDAAVLWEVYDYVDSDPATGRMLRTYRERPASSLTCQVSFNNGTNFEAATNEAIHYIPLAYRGSQFVLRLTNASATPMYVGAWAVVY